MINQNLLNKFIAEALLYKAAEKGTSQKDLAKNLDISESFLSDSIYGRKKFNVKHIFLMINELKIPASFLYPNRETFELIKTTLGYQDYDAFLIDLEQQIYKENANET